VWRLVVLSKLSAFDEPDASASIDLKRFMYRAGTLFAEPKTTANVSLCRPCLLLFSCASNMVTSMMCSSGSSRYISSPAKKILMPSIFELSPSRVNSLTDLGVSFFGGCGFFAVAAKGKAAS